jgi:hypothetical protein
VTAHRDSCWLLRALGLAALLGATGLVLGKFGWAIGVAFRAVKR